MSCLPFVNHRMNSVNNTTGELNITPEGPGPHFLGGKKEEMTEGRKASRANKATTPAPLSSSWIRHCNQRTNIISSVPVHVLRSFSRSWNPFPCNHEAWNRAEPLQGVPPGVVITNKINNHHNCRTIYVKMRLHLNEVSFSYERMSTKTCFEKETK